MSPLTASPPHAADLALAERCASGDRSAQEQLFEAQKQRVHRILYRVLGSNRDVEDLAQEAFVAVFRALPSYRGEASLATFVDRITTRVAYRHLSLAPPPGARLALIWSQASHHEATAEQSIHARELVRRLYAVLDRLPPKYRVAYALHVIDERPITEVAALTEVSVVAAKNRVWRARHRVERSVRLDPVLKELLSRWGEGTR